MTATTLDASHKEWREAIHESRNVAQASIGKARESKKKSAEAIEIAKCAINLLEKAKDMKKP